MELGSAGRFRRFQRKKIAKWQLEINPGSPPLGIFVITRHGIWDDGYPSKGVAVCHKAVARRAEITGIPCGTAKKKTRARANKNRRFLRPKRENRYKRRPIAARAALTILPSKEEACRQLQFYLYRHHRRGPA